MIPLVVYLVVVVVPLLAGLGVVAIQRDNARHALGETRAELAATRVALAAVRLKAAGETGGHP